MMGFSTSIRRPLWWFMELFWHFTWQVVRKFTRYTHSKSLSVLENYLFQVTGKGLEKIANVEFVQNIMRVTFCNMIYIIGWMELTKKLIEILIL